MTATLIRNTAITPRYSTLWWDFDGTLANTLEVGVRIFNRLASARGFKTVDNPLELRGLTHREILRRQQVPWWKLPGLVRSLIAELRNQMPSVELYPGIPETVRQVQSLGIRQGVVSSNSEANIRSCLERHGLSQAFSTIHGTSRLGGKQRILRRLLRQHRLAAREVLYVGDEVRDVLAARSAGIDVAAVGWGMNDCEVLTRHNATFVVQRAEDVVDCLGEKASETRRG